MLLMHQLQDFGDSSQLCRVAGQQLAGSHVPLAGPMQQAAFIAGLIVNL